MAQKTAMYGMRDTQCPRCLQLLRKEDFTGAGICLWCQFDLDEPARALAEASRKVPCETASHACAKVPPSH